MPATISSGAKQNSNTSLTAHKRQVLVMSDSPF